MCQIMQLNNYNTCMKMYVTKEASIKKLILLTPQQKK